MTKHNSFMKLNEKKNSLRNTPKTVITCYDLLNVALAGGISDFTDGKYFGKSDISYEEAQVNQAQYLLNEAHCTNNSKLLDIGCGNGRILETAKTMGAEVLGITISEPQVTYCIKKGLNVLLMNYKNIPKSWNNRFDCIIANGSVEHFVQVKDALEGKQDEIYREMFEICNRILKPKGRFVTTIMHDNSNLDPAEIIKGSSVFPRGSSNFHFARVLLEDFGGWYPKRGQLEKSAEGLFKLEKSEEGKEDYHLTSEAWLKAIQENVKTNPRVWLAIITKVLKHGRRAISMLDTLAVAQSWMWQFRQDSSGKTPTMLYRDTWQKMNGDRE